MQTPIFLIGPTGTGKSKTAVFLAKRLNAEIVSCDSMQVYKGMDIGTAKPSLRERFNIPHYMIDIIDIRHNYDVFQYRQSALKIIEKIHKKGKAPLITGGTGLYFRALIDGLFKGPGKNEEIRNKIEEEIKKNGLPVIYKKLESIDPVACKKINPNDKRRIVRGLEVYYLTNRPISLFQKQWKNPSNPSVLDSQKNTYMQNAVVIGLIRKRDDLYNRINKRVEQMFGAGLVKETQKLIKKGIMQNKTASQALGYKEIIGYLNKKYSLDEAKELLQRNTRRLAKRQLTWFKKDNRVKWFFIKPDEKIQNTAEKIIEFLTGISHKKTARDKQ